MAWADAARAALSEGPTALVTILATEGLSPCGAGTRMVVTPRAVAGSIGAAPLDARVVEQARALLTLPPGSWRIQDYPIPPGAGCGGRLRLLLESLESDEWFDWVGRAPLTSHLALDRIERALESRAVPAVAARGDRPRAFVEPVAVARRPLVLFGAGAVGQAIAAGAARLPFQLAWFDSRVEAAERPGVMLAEPHAMLACASAVAAAVLVLTHDPALDDRLTAAALRGPTRFVGRLGPRGGAVERDARLAWPAGLPAIDSKDPEVIAISVLAQLLSLEEHG